MSIYNVYKLSCMRIGLYRDVWIAAIASSRTRFGDSNGGNVSNVTMRITFVTRKFGNVERNSHCDVLHITPVRVARLFLDCNGDFAIKAFGVGYYCLETSTSITKLGGCRYS